VYRAAQIIPSEGAAEMKQAMLDAMDRMSRYPWGVVERQESDDGRGVQAIAQLLRVQERRSRLMGLDAPTRRAVDVITHDRFMRPSRTWRPTSPVRRPSWPAMTARTPTLTAQIWTNAPRTGLGD
jgi:hypothetical protein